VLASPASFDRAVAIVAAIERDLDEAEATLAPHSGSYALFLQSATIILREGFEVVLIIGALLAYVVKSGNSQMRRSIQAGALGGIVLSVATAYIISRLFAGVSGVAVEALEGLTLLLAAAVLFWVSYWLISKAQADRWQRFIQGKLKAALSRGSGVALAGVALLAVYREGVETTLFYQALLGSAAGQQAEVAAGFVAGLVGLAIVYVVFVRLGLRVPMRQFFLATSAFLYYLAFTFAGTGIAELQRAGWVPLTPVAGFPQIDFIGLYPTVESLVAQAVLAVCLVYALIVTLRQRVEAREHPEPIKRAAQQR
jgi:high-affinity iron transporter